MPVGSPELSRRRLTERARAASPAPIPIRSGPLHELVPGRSVEGEQGAYWLAEIPVHDALPHGGELLAAFGRIIQETSGGNDVLARLSGAQPGEIVLLDTETGGLSSAPVFLVGVIVWPGERHDDALVLQMLARDYAEERAVLAAAAGLLEARSTLITYNGRSFDLPMVRERMVYHGLGPCPEPPTHLDLLHEVRARFRGRWADCRLETLERHLCGRSRWADIAGAQIPDAWHEFVHTGEAGRIAQIIEHNRLDLITMLEVLPHLRASSGS